MAGYTDGSSAERYGNGAPVIFCSRSCRRELGAVGRKPGLDAMVLARLRRRAGGTCCDRLLSAPRFVRQKVNESNLHAPASRRGRIRSLL